MARAHARRVRGPGPLTLGNDALAMGAVIVAALLVAVVVLVVVVRPWQLPEADDGGAPAVAH